ncbi:tetratricopeptide repeat protein [Bacillus haynesii]|uniref:tetratricopeptide repeat protein n=1 Tax=Bacillus TaxID=1386 RepID=UPI00092B1590|nr:MULTISPECIES: tetratricopeptide repeat protein [Bacillus]MCY7967799.1 tetratricopeptide repeat protein [Bacillus haynesii]MCY8102371.1 tetratricopeptide repeat protein [Bacillus haynesii]MCY8665008.1 tetratricopeptide repeat protein [Bacillus haynesii]MEC1348030.1 tetratricopeptide repeat protein [Bacillus haynesii]OJT66845.1 hypothetical protein BFP46_22570 [Bacillus licheniformis]
MIPKQKRIASPFVANLLNTWNDYMTAGKFHESSEVRQEVEALIRRVEDDTDLLEYFYLLDYQHCISFGTKENSDRKKVVSMLSNGHHELMIAYYYYFYSGVYAFHKKNYIQAISFYELAEQKLILIPDFDETKFAEFHYKLAQAYYQIDQHLFSVSHVTKARDIFIKHDIYKLEAVECKILLGANMYDMRRYDESDSYYRNALTDAKAYGYDKLVAKIYHNLGLIHWQLGSLDTALLYLQRAYSEKTFLESEYGVRTVYMLSSVLYQQGKSDEALKWYNLGMEMAVRLDDFEYKAKLKVLFHLYENPSAEQVKESLAYLEEKNIWPDVADLYKRIADFYEEQGDLVLSHEFLKGSLYARDQISKITEALA